MTAITWPLAVAVAVTEDRNNGLSANSLTLRNLAVAVAVTEDRNTMTPHAGTTPWLWRSPSR